MKKDIVKQISESMELAYKNANKLIEAEKKQKPFYTIKNDKCVFVLPNN